MEVKNNYEECLTNLACSISKYFELSYKHNTLSYIDKILEETNPKNVIVILFDGMGSNILNRTLDKNSFFIKNKLKDITTVFPATTTAATTSMRSGLNPIEHGWLGWNTYIKPIDKTITLFLNSEKGKEEVCNEFLEVKNKLVNETIVQKINKEKKYNAIELFPFGKDNYNDIDDMFKRILEESKKPGKNYIYAYDPEPDHTMHMIGTDNETVKELIKKRQEYVEQLCNNVKESIIIVIADHGHINCKNIFLKNYPDFLNLLERTTSLEQRAVSFKVKEEYKEIFKEKFNELFGQYFSLYTKEDVISSKLFGDGEQNELFEPALGDYIAIAESTNACLVCDNDEVLFSQHAGYTDDEVYVPLILTKR